MERIFEFLDNYKGIIKVNGKIIKKTELKELEELGGDLSIDLIPSLKTEYRVVVRGWMTIENNNNLEFHKRWNNGIPMPSTVMIGEIIDETPGMRLMNLRTEDGTETWKGYVSKAGTLKLEEL